MDLGRGRPGLVVKFIVRRDAVIPCGRDYHSEVTMIAASQDSWDVTHVGFEFIFEMV